MSMTSSFLLIFLRPPAYPGIHFLPVDSIPQMDLKIIHARLWTWRVQFPGTIQTLDPGIIHKFHIIGWFPIRVHSHGDG